MRKKITAFFLLTGSMISLHADWGSIGSEIASVGETIGGFVKQMGESMAGTAPSGYNYSFQVFNGANTGMYVDIHKSQVILGAQTHVNGGDSLQLAPGQDSGNTFYNEHLYFEIEISAPGVNVPSYKDLHYTLGAQNDPTAYYYHCYNDTVSGLPYTELLGAGYTTSAAFSGRIQNATASVSSVSYTITATTGQQGPSSITITIPDLDPNSFNYLTFIPQGFSIRPSQLNFTQGSVLIPAQGIAQVVDATKNTSTQSTINYVINQAGAFETGMGPGNFQQPKDSTQLRDISPVACQIYNQGATQATPLGQLVAQDIPWQSVWAVYEGSGWSQAQGAVVTTPMWQIPSGTSGSCFLIRPSIAAMQKNGPARLIVLRLNIPEKPSESDIQKAQSFLSKLIAGTLTVKALATGDKGGTLITQQNNGTISLPSGWYVSGQAPFNMTQPFPAYPALSQTYLGQTIAVSSLTMAKKAELLGLTFPDDVGVLEDATTGVKGYILATDVFNSYGVGAGPFYYFISPCYVDLGQMLGTMIQYAGMCNYQGMTADLYNQLTQSFLPQTMQQWITQFSRNPAAVQDSVASFLVLLGAGDIQKLTSAFSQGSSFYVDSRAKNKLSPQGNALLKMLLYGPCSISQLPTYYKAGQVYSSEQSGWPATSVQL